MIRNDKDFNVSVGQRYLLVILASLLCFVVGSVVVTLMLGDGTSAPRMRIAMVMQDILMFVLPALIIAVIVARRPGDFLELTKAPGWSDVMLVLFALVVSAPAMNFIIEWNQQLSLPESLSGVEQWMREAERNAESSIKVLTGNTSVGGLVMSLLIIGVLAGFSEELFFRGALQQVFVTTPMSAHVAIWISAVLFSAMHMQFFGFFPRLLLGGFFGYLVYWSGSLWLAMIAHVANNCMAVTLMWVKARSGGEIDIDRVGTAASGGDWPILAVSVVLTALIITTIYRRNRVLKK